MSANQNRSALAEAERLRDGIRCLIRDWVEGWENAAPFDQRNAYREIGELLGPDYNNEPTWVAPRAEPDREEVAAPRGCVTDDDMLDALLAQTKADALRSQAEFFRQIDMPGAADHCEQAAISWDHSRSIALDKRGGSA